ncbi:hypothetical protein ACFWJW_13665 [Streptomyces sp. NPDC127097]|uniref:hypothetical protein n=1 Tax=Streptomyces sp. NPDC127097 TaxID=3347136 RepID=UPI00365D36D6
MALGGLLDLLLVREPTGRSSIAPEGGNPLKTLAGSVSIMRRRPRVAVGAAVRVFSTGSQFGFLVCLPFFSTETVGFSTSAWLRLLSVMNLGAGASTFAGPAVVAVALGPVGVQGIAWIFALLHLATAVAIRFLEPDPEFTAPAPGPSSAPAVDEAGVPAGRH